MSKNKPAAPAPSSPSDATKDNKAANPETTQSPSESFLIGSSHQPSVVVVAGAEVALGVAVATAQAKSGLTVEAWNALAEEDRDIWIDAEIDLPSASEVEAKEALKAEEKLSPELVGRIEAKEPASQRGQTASLVHADESSFQSEPTTTDDAPAVEPTFEELMTIAERARVQNLEQEQAAAAAATAGPVVPESVKAVVADAGQLAQQFLEQLLSYMKAMAPRQHQTPATAAAHQVGLYRTLLGIVNKLEEDFPAAWGATLRLFHEHRDGVFHETRVFRAFEEMILSEAERNQFVNLLNLIKATADPQSRAMALKQTDMNRTFVDQYVTQIGQDRLLAFYGL